MGQKAYYQTSLGVKGHQLQSFVTLTMIAKVNGPITSPLQEHEGGQIQASQTYSARI